MCGMLKPGKATELLTGTFVDSIASCWHAEVQKRVMCGMLKPGKAAEQFTGNFVGSLASFWHAEVHK